MNERLAQETKVKLNNISQEEKEQAIKELKKASIPAIRVIGRQKPEALTTLEVFMISVISLLIFGMLVINMHASNSASDMNRRIQDLNHEISQTETMIDNLTQHKHELMQYQRLQEIAKKQGLEVRDENIVNLWP